MAFLDLFGKIIESGVTVGFEAVLEKSYANHPEKWNQKATILLAFAGVLSELEAETKQAWLKDLEEGTVTAVNEEIAKHPPTV